MLTGWLGLVYAIVKAIPVLDKAIRELLVFYAEKEREWAYEKISKGIFKAITGKDQRDIEVAIGSPRAGKPSGDTDSEFTNPDKPK
jgi:hypothetical protein